MMRLAILGGVVLIAVTGVAAVTAYIIDARDRETHLERENDIKDAISSCAELPWFERLRCDE